MRNVFSSSSSAPPHNILISGCIPVSTPIFRGEHAGSNDSSDDNFIQGEGDDEWYDLKFKFLLPIGHGKHTLINTYYLKNGLLSDGKTGGDVWNPLTSGRTNFELSIFNRHRTIINDSGTNVGDSNGTMFALEYDNRDFFANPTKGSLQKITFKKDFGYKSTDNWSVVQLDLRKYYDLGRSKRLRQSVLALDYWTSYTPSWEPRVNGLGPFIDGRPPNELGSTLGGFYRLRAYPVNRFSDKAAVYYSAEYRMIPEWNPLGSMKLLKPLNIDWWMFVPFVELGRVAPHWSVSDLHTDMRKVAGLGLRIMAQKAVFRLDTAVSEDAWSMYAMVGHPF
ncbi:MAG: BamA/TamA family outer membrane protein [Thiotrichales bacterium]|nr:MAG: BamA/TamA family outer membrane protein [Thiotrichales bacterium]